MDDKQDLNKEEVPECSKTAVLVESRPMPDNTPKVRG